jgi:hypothetical protein
VGGDGAIFPHPKSQNFLAWSSRRAAMATTALLPHAHPACKPPPPPSPLRRVRRCARWPRRLALSCSPSTTALAR